MSDINHPIVGDTRYKSKNNPIGRLALHASTLIVKDPLTHNIHTFSSAIPEEFNNIIK